jgi:hypothetical protein
MIVTLMGRAESCLRDTEMCDIISQMVWKGCSAEQGIKNRNTEMGSVMGREEKDYEETDRIGICDRSYDRIVSGDGCKS